MRRIRCVSVNLLYKPSAFKTIFMDKFHKIKINLKVKHENYHVRMLDNLNLSESSHTKKAKIILMIC